MIVVYVDGLRFGEQTVIAAVGVDRAGRKHVLGMQHGATENAAAAQDLLTSLVERGLSPDKKRLFVIDDSKALRAAIRKVFGATLRRAQAAQRAGALARGAARTSAGGGAGGLEARRQTGPGAARQAGRVVRARRAGRRGGLARRRRGVLHDQRLGVPPSLWRCLATTNIIESPNAGVRLRTARITRWQDADMVQRWLAASLLDAEKSFRKIMGHRDLWMLDAILNPASSSQQEAA